MYSVMHPQTQADVYFISYCYKLADISTYIYKSGMMSLKHETILKSSKATAKIRGKRKKKRNNQDRLHAR